MMFLLFLKSLGSKIKNFFISLKTASREKVAVVSGVILGLLGFIVGALSWRNRSLAVSSTPADSQERRDDFKSVSDEVAAVDAAKKKFDSDVSGINKKYDNSVAKIDVESKNNVEEDKKKNSTAIEKDLADKFDLQIVQAPEEEVQK